MRFIYLFVMVTLAFGLPIEGFAKKKVKIQCTAKHYTKKINGMKHSCWKDTGCNETCKPEGQGVWGDQ